MYTYETFVTLRDSDAAGVMFFARFLTLAHEAYETFLRDNGMNFGNALRNSDLLMPVVHSECDYRKPLFLGESLRITVRLAEIRSRAFTIAYELFNGEGELAANASITHAAASRTVRKSIPLPDDVIDVLRKLE